MNRPRRSLLLAARTALCCAGFAAFAGCAQELPKAKPVAPKYHDSPDKVVPAFLHNTVFEKVDVGNTEPFQISGYGLVVNLDSTGDSTAPFAVKQYMIKEMLKHGYGSKLNPGWEHQSPERVLNDKRVAIVQVVGMLPAGIRKGQSFDVLVQALQKNTTSSLAGGELYLTELAVNGADPTNPFSKPNVFAHAKGFLFVNPAYALNRDVTTSAAARQSLRNAVIMDGGVAKFDRPLFLVLRKPESRVSRYIEQHIIDRFQDQTVAAAQDEGIIQIFVPHSYNGDWQHFEKLVTHLYLDVTPDQLAAKAKMLVAEAQKPDAMLEDISYCWEGIGPAALPFITPLLTDARSDIAYSAARAAAFIGDPSGAPQAALLEMARNPKHPFQLNAVQTLGAMPASAAINHMLRDLLDGDKTLVRIEAYKVLARNRDPFISTRVVTDSRQKFALDVVPSHGPPIVFASRTGIPRIAIIGAMPEISIPVVFSAMNDRLTISSGDIGRDLTIFYRTPASTDAQGRISTGRLNDPVKMVSSPELKDIVLRLGGGSLEDEKPLDFTYSEVVAILQRLNDEKKLMSNRNGVQTPAAFVLQDPPSVQRTIYNAPRIDSSRPQGELQSRAPGSDPAAEAVIDEKKR